VNVFSPCVVFNKTNDYAFYRRSVFYQETPARSGAEFVQLLEAHPFPLGVLWRWDRPAAARLEASPADTTPSDDVRRWLRRTLA
ncbi:MAG: hypothetical protein K6T81_17255, partial [Alicyclobacillus macrosporangiidus]|nr:hypothetical protein [Alicyclobacillus macrosporangiidus]